MLDALPARRYSMAVLQELFSDPKARRLYLATKAVMVVAVAGLTWPLSMVIGPVAWWGLAAFAAVMLLLALPVLLLRTEPPDGEGTDDVVSALDRVAKASAEHEVVRLPIEDQFDLHPFAPAEIPDVVRSYLDEAFAAGFEEVRLIHGRGIGVQRERVRTVLAGDSRVAEYHDAPPDRGGWGATVARFRREG